MAPHDNTKLKKTAAAVAVTSSRVPDISVNTLQPRWADKYRFSCRWESPNVNFKTRQLAGEQSPEPECIVAQGHHGYVDRDYNQQFDRRKKMILVVHRPHHSR